MKAGKSYIALLSAAGMLLLIFDSKTAQSAAVSGIDLCIHMLIPSLFPFLVLSVLLTGTLSSRSARWMRWFCKLLKIPTGAESLLVVSTLGGYPAGAQSISALCRQGQINSVQAMRLLAFCNNAGPAFIFGVLGASFSSNVVPFVLWSVHVVSAFLVGMLLPCAKDAEKVSTVFHDVRLTDAIAQSIKTMALICGWVICLKIMIAYADSFVLKFLPLSAQVIITGLLELSNGCLRLSEVEFESIRFLIASFLLPLGGLCVALQTAAVTKGISMRLYFPGKILQCCISVFLSCLFQFVLPFEFHVNCAVPAIFSISIAIFIISNFQYSKKTVEFQPPLMYNRLNNSNEVSSCCFVKQ